MGRLTSPKRLGIMGGMGPMATVDLYSKIIALTPASYDQEHIPVVIDSFPQIEDRTAYILEQGETPLPKMLESATRLKQAGAEALLIACNTAHYFAESIQQQIDIPIISIIDATIAELESCNQKSNKLKKIAVLATNGTIKSQLYQTKLTLSGFEVVNLSPSQQKILMDCIYLGAKANKVTEYQDDFQTLIDSIEADAYIAACTEIPLFTPHLKGGYCVIDATLALAKKAVIFAQEN
ncbi:aspartate/glutamate racemase family protein [Phocoenobacter skyensis]|uniref:Amino acid racemase n=1 Tax=Phocoenobacter skyensis TaxID=97481 RepID=A0A1H7WJF7_9PAST|nr:amino acid racemase [Pasteurella skyensis]MDP8079242.1 amino acid racemase [Pasteurella skyensis]MDP8085148.1 amino acid racemase [Pasteurella skyensis]MDP8170043.1 amino acid racemase [Pasteurella skyensis]MDP8175086.1 amino acid racemase [Pasteurella skyensis]MDP8185065.1 amino acid racemase [Pasteurella skyensis]